MTTRQTIVTVAITRADSKSLMVSFKEQRAAITYARKCHAMIGAGAVGTFTETINPGLRLNFPTVEQAIETMYSFLSVAYHGA